MTIHPFFAYLTTALISVSFLLTFIRLVIGPSLADRVVALELLSIVSIGGIAAATVITGKAVLLDVAVVLALMSFLGTVGFAYYLSGKAGDSPDIGKGEGAQRFGKGAGR